VIITGAGSGIGLIAARELARVGAAVIAAVRDPSKARPALAKLAGSVEVRQLDVSDRRASWISVEADDLSVLDESSPVGVRLTGGKCPFEGYGQDIMELEKAVLTSSG
jgi:NAD(P)-dependent dehydrogenase (short-subunit alcohol dehydrogenase family)